MTCQSDRDPEFQLEGRFLGFAAEAGGYKLKYIRLATATGEQQIKLSKDLRSPLYRLLTPGEWIQVSGSQKLSSGRMKLKAYQVSPIDPAAQRQAIAPASKSACILVCQKSDCCKRGSREVATALQAELNERGLADQVTIKATGCMKRCKEGANLVMPDKSRHSRVRPRDVEALVDRHIAAKLELETRSAIEVGKV
jgi:(2Fe-2S) ferredoxin